MWGVILIIIIVVFAYLLAIFTTSFSALLFQPKGPYISTPNYTYTKILIEDRLVGWNFSPYPKRKTVLFCHGNYGNISYTDFVIKLCHRHQLNCLVFDYRGYGESEGAPSPYGVCHDGEAAYKYLSKRVPAKSIIIWGMSLGGAVATYIASRNPCHCLILMATFSSIDDIFVDTYYSTKPGFLPRLATMVFGMLVDPMPSKSRICDVKCPILIMHSPDDELIPYSNAIRLYDSINHGCRQLIEISGGHATPVISESNLQSLLKFCKLDCSQCHLSRDVLAELPYIRDRYLQLEGM